MPWFGGALLLLVCIGRTVTGELFNFDLSSLRPEELCKPSEIWRERGPRSLAVGPTVNFCPVENHIKLFGADKPVFLQRIAQIQKSSANRAVSLFVQNQSSLIDASILAPIGKQIVEFIIVYNAPADLTSRFPAIGLSNLLDLRFWDCDGLRIHKTDFSGLKNIRAIEFKAASPAFIEEGTFTNLPTLQTLALGNDVGDWNPERLAVYKQLKCDAKNAWLWKFLKGKPGLQKRRGVGEIFKLGNFTATFMEADQPDATCS